MQKTKCKICPKLKLDTLPFRTWLGMKHGVYDTSEVSRYHLNNLWLEYRADMSSVGLLWESAKNFGLWG